MSQGNVFLISKLPTTLPKVCFGLTEFLRMTCKHFFYQSFFLKNKLHSLNTRKKKIVLRSGKVVLWGSGCCWVDALPRVYIMRTMPTFMHLLLFYSHHNTFSISFLVIYAAKFRQTEFSPIPANSVCSRSQIRLHNFCLYYICLYYTITR